MSESQESWFQGIGCLYGNIYNNENGWNIEVKGNSFKLFIPPKLYRGWCCQMKKDKNLYLRVYPRSFLSPQKKEPQLYFQVVTWSKEVLEGDTPGMFYLKGIWQKIPQSRFPVLTIYRNQKAEDPLNKYKNNHIPCIIRRDDCTPYRYDVKTPKENIEKFFIQGVFKFIPDKQTFGFQKDLAPPSRNIPKYKRPQRTIPAKEEKVKVYEQSRSN